MKPKDLDYIRETVNQEGFDYAFTGYSNFEEIKDKEFHRLREAYLKARKELAEYIGID